MRHAAKVDTNQPEIVRALRKVGCSVQSLSAVGRGCPDLLVGRAGAAYLLEVKDDGHRRNRDPHASEIEQQLTPMQLDWHRTWRGHVAVVHSAEEALKAVGL